MALVRSKLFAPDVNSLAHPDVLVTVDLLCGAAADEGVRVHTLQIKDGYLLIGVDDATLERDYVKFFREVLGRPVEVVPE